MGLPNRQLKKKDNERSKETKKLLKHFWKKKLIFYEFKKITSGL